MTTGSTPPPLRILLMAPVPPPMGGVARWASRFIAAAPAHGLDVRVLNVAPVKADRSESSRFRTDRAGEAFGILAKVERELRHHRPQVLHITSNLYWATARDGAALLLAARHGIPAVFNLRGSNQMVAWREGLPRLARFALDGVLKRAGAVTVLSVELESYLRDAVPGARIERISNMVEATSPAATPLLPARKCPIRVLFVGWRMPGKGVGELAEAVLDLPGVELVCIGDRVGAADAAAEAQMDRHLAALRATGRLLEVADLPPEQVLNAYHEADIFALPTYQEGLPNVLLEAMAAGLPCVVTPVGAIPDVVGTDRALVVQPREVAPLRAALARLAADGELRRTLGERARRHVAEKHSTVAVLGAYRQLYADLIQRRRDAG